MKRVIAFVLVFVLGFVACALTLRLMGFTSTAKQAAVNVLSAQPGGARRGDLNPVAAAAAKVGPSVVSVYTVTEREVSNPIARAMGLPDSQRLRAEGAGSGVILTSDGYIITNNHVVAGANSINVVLKDGRQFPAKLVGRDRRSEIAVVKVSARDLPAAELGNSSAIQIGDWAIAVGNPFGELENTVSLGVISATRRRDLAVEGTILPNLIQTDAAINPGNSGGALCDIQGRVIGINTVIASPTGSSVGIGFAIPIDTARMRAEQLIRSGEIQWPYMGVSLADIRGEAAQVAAQRGFKGNEGAFVVQVAPNGPAASAGMQAGDIVLSFAGRKIESASALVEAINSQKVGADVPVVVWRNGKEVSTRVTLGHAPRDSQ